VRARWEALTEVAGRRDVRLRDALKRAEPCAAGDGRLTLRLARTEVMARSTLERREMQAAFRQAAREVLGAELVPLLETAAEGVGARGDAGLRDHPAVRQVTEATGGRVLQAEREAPPPAGS
jgi:hypothetical protein